MSMSSPLTFFDLLQNPETPSNVQAGLIDAGFLEFFFTNSATNPESNYSRYMLYYSMLPLNLRILVCKRILKRLEWCRSQDSVCVDVYVNPNIGDHHSVTAIAKPRLIFQRNLLELVPKQLRNNQGYALRTADFRNLSKALNEHLTFYYEFTEAILEECQLYFGRMDDFYIFLRHIGRGRRQGSGDARNKLSHVILEYPSGNFATSALKEFGPCRQVEDLAIVLCNRCYELRQTPAIRKAWLGLPKHSNVPRRSGPSSQRRRFTRHARFTDRNDWFVANPYGATHRNYCPPCTERRTLLYGLRHTQPHHHYDRLPSTSGTYTTGSARPRVPNQWETVAGYGRHYIRHRWIGAIAEVVPDRVLANDP